mmetsp:Transcript_9549/g.28490  ORF Transcript_9549/g.28490 Transcript_9549/m.28490 type:complete len:694 (-) Transcript_9549:272-2353(-)|eukprot:CAMPEP_0172365998 /NCGR_PEP_ID=MMETSP1060-20121228/13196_1 /TAXON_ID=37318 /ORGANISM="Pseudo-nitzschia pungens, Strain cf. cingulata" /LENGTH=693 /DNA_ID=CAMNT_0013089661 /DNA_START=86 /DNA_END=2167 /DNA_ORIENTATION=+
MPPQQEENIVLDVPLDLEKEVKFTVSQEQLEDVSSPPVADENNAPKASQNGNNASEEKLLSFFTGMKNDLIARQPYYNMKGGGVGDWGKPDNFFTVFNATIFAFVIQLIPALIFAELMDRQTEGNLATAETLLSSAIIGIIYAIFSGQPLVIMGITGPVSLLLGTSYGLAEQFNADYFPFFFWICVWAGLMHVLSAMVGLVSLVWKVTPFTSQIFELFIAITFIYSALRDMIVPIHLTDNDIDGEEVSSELRSAGYASFIIGLITCYVAWTLHFAENWIFFSRQMRTFLTSYNTLIAVVFATAFSYIPGIDQGNAIERVNVVAPWDWQPTADRAWVVNPLEGIGLQGIFGALVPGFMFFLLFIIDHNVSSILTQSPKFNLKKPDAYHWDFFVLGITFFPCALLGLPPGNGLIPQAPLHCRALCTRTIETDKYGVKREVVTHCEEQRWSGLGQALLMFVALSAFTVISWIPTGCLFGLLLYLGMSALHGNEIWERLLLIGVYAHKRPKIPVVRCVAWKTVQAWTFIQLACAVAIWAVGQYAHIGYIYPLLLTLLVPFRSYVLEHFFDAEDTKHLDPVDETEEEFHDEQRMIHHTLSHTEENDDMLFPTRAEFRGQGMKRVLMNTNRRHTIGGQGGSDDDILALEVAKACIDLDLDDKTKLEIVQRAAQEDVRIKASTSITDLMALDNLGSSKQS